MEESIIAFRVKSPIMTAADHYFHVTLLYLECVCGGGGEGGGGGQIRLDIS